MVNYLSDGQMIHHAIRDVLALDTVPARPTNFPSLTRCRTSPASHRLIVRGQNQADESTCTREPRPSQEENQYPILMRFEPSTSEHNSIWGDPSRPRGGVEARGQHMKSIAEASSRLDHDADILVLMPWSLIVGLTVGELLRRARMRGARRGVRSGTQLREMYRAGSGLLRSTWELPGASQGLGELRQDRVTIQR